MATFDIGFFDINGEPLNTPQVNYVQAYSKGSEHGFRLRFRASDGGTAASFDQESMFVEVGKSLTMDGIVDYAEETFKDYPCRFDSTDLAGMLSFDRDTTEYTLSLPYGKPPELPRESVTVKSSIPVSSTDASLGNLKGDVYQLLTKAEAEEKVEHSISLYTGYSRIYMCCYDTEKELYRYLRAHTYGNTTRWCISNVAADSLEDGNTYIIMSSTFNGWKADADNPDAELQQFTRSDDGGDTGIPGEVVYQGIFSFAAGETEHDKEKTLYVRIGDGTNSTAVMEIKVKIWMNGPENIVLSLTGSSGNSGYTGFRRKGNRFMPAPYVKAIVSAGSDIPMRCRLSGSCVAANYAGGAGATSWMKLIGGASRSMAVKLMPSSVTFFNNDAEMTIYVIVEDAAGNTNVASLPSGGIEDARTSSEFDTIRLLTGLFRTAHENLVEETASQRHKVYTVSGAMLTLVRQTVVSTDPNDYTRSWNEIWYPDTHRAPLNDDGTINTEEAMRISQPNVDVSGKTGPKPEELLQYDRLAMNADYSALLTDNDGRYYTAAADWSNGKTYPGMVNSRMSGGVYGTYWIIDNTGNPDFRLEFEYFDFSGDVTSLPVNLAAPYDGDMLCVYDASDPEAVNVLLDSDGRTRYTLKDSSKLVPLFTLKGSYNPNESNPITMVDSTLPGALTLTDCGLITPNITSCSRICLVPFTDSGDTGSSVASGFKLKAGPKHMATRENFEYSSTTGEFWIHLSPQTSTSGRWSSASQVAIDYKYYDSFATTDCETGTISVSSRTVRTLLATFNAFTYLGTDGSCELPYERFSAYDKTEGPDQDTGYLNPHCIRTFATTEDDYVDYVDPAFYVEPIGTEMNTASIYNVDENTFVGKMVSGYSCNKDTGVLTINDSVTTPLGRLFGTYSYHTFYRLTSDGYGDLYFYGTGVLVPATVSNSYTDWAYVDLRVVNEGTNTLHDGLLQFLARGYITTGSVVDTVLDNNRPWDVQEGTAAETVQRTGARVATSHSALNNGTNSKATRTNAFNARASQSAVLGTIDPKGMVYVRVFWCIANNAEGTAWIDVTRGKKVFSAELAGRFYLFSN